MKYILLLSRGHNMHIIIIIIIIIIGSSSSSNSSIRYGFLLSQAFYSWYFSWTSSDP